MKLNLLVLILYSLNMTCGERDQIRINSEIVFTTTLKGSYNLPEHAVNDSIYYFLIDCNIINNSDSTVHFTTHSCAIPAYVVTDDKEIKVCHMNCSGNFMTGIKLQTKESFSFPLILKTNKNNVNKILKIGWIFLTPQYNLDSWEYADLLMKSKTNLENVLWSEPIELFNGGGTPYKIFSGK